MCSNFLVSFRTPVASYGASFARSRSRVRGRHVALYLDDQINLEVGVELQTPWAGYGEVVGSALPAGTVATTVHFGPYNRLHEAHQAIRDWCANHGYALAGPSWEIYGHWEDAWNSDPSRIRTDVFYLLTAGGKSEDDSLTSELLESNPEFQALVAKSKVSPRKPFQANRGYNQTGTLASSLSSEPR